jgi:membrane protein implicated in regulation of membrane protease activity
MPWWGWLVIGFGLLGVEMFVIDAQFYLVFIGLSGITVGLLGLTGVAMPDWAQWLLFAGLSLAIMALFRRRVYAKLRGNLAPPIEQAAGDWVRVPTRLEPGQSCRLDFRGSPWTARNIGTRPIEAGSEVRITQVDNLTLLLTSDAA